MLLKIFTMTTALLFSTQARSDQFIEAMERFVDTQVSHWIADDVIISAVRAQNTLSQNYELSDILAHDKAWQAEAGLGRRPTIDRMLSNDASQFLRARVEEMGGIISEIIIMDAAGLNAAVSAVTSDMWQGDEDKYRMTYLTGVDGFHLSEVIYDVSTETYQCQISFTLVDPITNSAVGAVTIGVNAEMFM